MQIDEAASSDGAVLLVLRGELDFGAAFDLETRLDLMLRGGAPRVVVDLRELGFIDSSGVRALLEGAQEARRRNAEFALIPPGEGSPVRRMFQVAGILEVLPFTEPPA